LITKRLLPLLVLMGITILTAACGANASGALASGAGGIAQQSGVASCADVTDPTIQMPANSNQQRFSAPDQVIDNTHTYCAILTTEHGRFIILLYPQYTPKNVNNFVFLASKGFYDNIPFHRVISGFMAQTGDPSGTGAGGPGYNNIPLEVNNPLKYDKPGVVGVARTSDPNSAGSQFFITFGPTPNLDGGYTIIGEVVSGMDVVRQIKIRDTDSDPNAMSIVPEKPLTVRVMDIGSPK
jgi:cyclophilin family peptidyl-prolyl cis-trans isomerase